MCRPLRPEAEAHRAKVRFKDRLEDDLGCGHRHPIPHRGNAEWAGLARLTRLRDMHPSQRRWPVGPGPQLNGERVEERAHPGVLDVFDRATVDTGSAPIQSDSDPRRSQHIAAGDLVEQGMEPPAPIGLGTAIEHALKGSNRVHAFGVADGSSRRSGTHQGSSLLSRTSMK